MISFLKLIRYKNLLMVLLTMVLTKYALINTIVKPKYLTDLQFVILVLSVLLITAAGYIINDIYDVEADKINKPNKFFISEIISIKKAIFLYVTLTLIGFFLGVYLSIIRNSHVLISIYLLCVFGLFFYSTHLKKIAVLGNLLISIFCGLTILLTYLFHTEYSIRNVSHGILLQTVIIYYSFFAFLTTFIREIIKDIEDVNGDLKIKAKTLPIVIGRKRASKIAFLFSCVLLVFLLIILQFLLNKYIYLVYGIVFLLLPLLYFMFKLWFSEKKKDYSELSNLIKIIMFFGILSMLLFKF